MGPLSTRLVLLSLLFFSLFCLPLTDAVLPVGAPWGVRKCRPVWMVSGSGLGDCLPLRPDEIELQPSQEQGGVCGQTDLGPNLGFAIY